MRDVNMGRKETACSSIRPCVVQFLARVARICQAMLLSGHEFPVHQTSMGSAVFFENTSPGNFLPTSTLAEALPIQGHESDLVVVSNRHHRGLRVCMTREQRQ